MQPNPIRWRDDAGAEADNEFLNLLLEGSRLLQQGDIQEARARLEQGLRLRPQNEKARNLLGQTYFKMGLYDAAKRLYLALVQEYPEEHTLRLNLALVHLKKGEMPLARVELERVYELRPDHQKALNYLGLVYERLDLLALARWAFKNAGSEKLATEMETKLRARGLPLEPESHPLPRLPEAGPESPAPHAEIQVSKLPEPSLAPAPAAPAPEEEDAQETTSQQQIDVAQATGEAVAASSEEAVTAPQQEPPAPQEEEELAEEKTSFHARVEDVPADAAADALAASDETTPKERVLEVDAALAEPAPAAEPVVVPPPLRGPLSDEEMGMAAAAAASVVRAAADAAPFSHAEPVVAAPAVELARPAPAKEEEPVTPATALPHLFRAMAAETGSASPEPEEGGSEGGPTRSGGPWSGAPTQDSMLLALSADAMTGDQWVERKGLPTVTRPFSPMSAGLLGLAVDGLVLARARTVAATQGELEMTAAHRDETGALLGGDEDPVVEVKGAGLLTLDPADQRVAVLKLDSSDATVLEAALFGATSGVVRGHTMVGRDGTFAGVPAVTFKGSGVVAVRSAASVRAVPVQAGQPFKVSMEHLLAFEGSLTCSAVPGIPGLPAAMMPRSVSLVGTGVALLRAGSRA